MSIQSCKRSAGFCSVGNKNVVVVNWSIIFCKQRYRNILQACIDLKNSKMRNRFDYGHNADFQVIDITKESK